jgi:hypothetical protein
MYATEKSGEGLEYQHLLAKRIWIEAIKGQQWACSLIFNRLEGLPIAHTEIERVESVHIEVTYVQNNQLTVTPAASGAGADHHVSDQPTRRRGR